MSERLYSEILEIATTLENKFQALVTDANNRYELYSLRRPAMDVPEDIAREGQVNILSPLVSYAANTIRADLMMNPTEFSCIPLGRTSGGGAHKNEEKQADNLERALAILWTRLNAGRVIDREVIWHQLCSPYGVMVLECNPFEAPDQGDLSDSVYNDLVEKAKREHLYWSVSTPDPTTCFFYERAGKPTIFVRHYKQMVYDVKNTYSDKPGPKAGYKLVLAKGTWDWVPISDDIPWTRTEMGTSDITEADMIWLDDGQNIYHVAINLANDDGEIVWHGPNPFGRISAFLVPSNITPLRTPEDRFEPHLLPLMNAVNQINTIRTTRATASRNKAGPDNYIALDPEIVKLYAQSDKQLPRTHKWKRGETAYLMGEVKEVPGIVDEDLDKLEQRLQEDLQKYLPSPFVHVLDPSIIKSATASAILNAAESGLRTYGPLMSTYDAAIRDLMLGVLHSLSTVYAEEEVSNYAVGDEIVHGVNMKPGSSHVLNAKAVNFPFLLKVNTRSMTQAQANAQFDLELKKWILPDGTKGPATFDDIIDAANYSDKAAQKEKLAKEEILKDIKPWIQQMAVAAAIVEIEAETGLVLPLGNEQMSPEAGSPTKVAGSNTMAAPLMTGPQGGSDPVG